MSRAFTIGVVRVITLRDEESLNRHGRILERAIPGIKTVSMCIEDQPDGIYDEESERVAVPKIVKTARKLVGMGVDGILISCAADPGVNEVRKITSKPVTGAGRPAALAALGIADRVGVLGIGEDPPKPFLDVLGDRLVAYARPVGVSKTLDLALRKDEIIEAARSLVEMGAEVVALACTGLSTVGAAPLIQKMVGVPVVDALLAAGFFLYHELVRTHRLEEVLV